MSLESLPHELVVRIIALAAISDLPTLANVSQTNRHLYSVCTKMFGDKSICSYMTPPIRQPHFSYHALPTTGSRPCLTDILCCYTFHGFDCRFAHEGMGSVPRTLHRTPTTTISSTWWVQRVVSRLNSNGFGSDLEDTSDGGGQDSGRAAKKRKRNAGRNKRTLTGGGDSKEYLTLAGPISGKCRRPSRNAAVLKSLLRYPVVTWLIENWIYVPHRLDPAKVNNMYHLHALIWHLTRSHRIQGRDVMSHWCSWRGGFNRNAGYEPPDQCHTWWGAINAAACPLLGYDGVVLPNPATFLNNPHIQNMPPNVQNQILLSLLNSRVVSVDEGLLELAGAGGIDCIRSSGLRGLQPPPGGKAPWDWANIAGSWYAVLTSRGTMPPPGRTHSPPRCRLDPPDIFNMVVVPNETALLEAYKMHPLGPVWSRLPLPRPRADMPFPPIYFYGTSKRAPTDVLRAASNDNHDNDNDGGHADSGYLPKAIYGVVTLTNDSPPELRWDCVISVHEDTQLSVFQGIHVGGRDAKIGVFGLIQHRHAENQQPPRREQRFVSRPNSNGFGSDLEDTSGAGDQDGGRAAKKRKRDGGRNGGGNGTKRTRTGGRDSEGDSGGRIDEDAVDQTFNLKNYCHGSAWFFKAPE